MENAGWLKIDRYSDEAKAADYDYRPAARRLLEPSTRGAWTSPLSAFVRAMYEAGKPTTAICHGQWVMVSAKILKGKRATAVRNIQIDLENAGAVVLDEPCVVDGNLITARFPYDLPRLVQATVQQLLATAGQASAAHRCRGRPSPRLRGGPAPGLRDHCLSRLRERSDIRRMSAVRG